MFDPIQKSGKSTRRLILIFDPVPSTCFRPPICIAGCNIFLSSHFQQMQKVSGLQPFEKVPSFLIHERYSTIVFWGMKGYLSIIPQHINMVRIFLVHKLSLVNRDPDEIEAIYIQYARQFSVSTFKKEVDEYCRHLWQRDIKQGLIN